MTKSIKGNSHFDGWTNLPNSSITSIRLWKERLIWKWNHTNCNLLWFHLRSTPSRGEQPLRCHSCPPSSLNFRLQVIRILRVRAHEITLTGWILSTLFFGITKFTLTKNSSMIFFSIANKQEKCIVEVTETVKLMFFTAENNPSHRSVVNNKYLKFKTVKWIETSLSRLTKIRNKNNKQKKN